MRALNLGQPLGGTVDAKVNWLVDAVKKIELSSREEYAESTPIKALPNMPNVRNVQQALALVQTLPRSTTTALEDVGDGINTAGKISGKAVINTTTGAIVTADGTDADDVWLALDGTTAHTPV